MELREAEQRVNEMLEWYTHLAIYGAVIPALAVVNVLTWHGVPWVLFAAVGWGIGLGAHGLRAQTLWTGGIERWRRRKIDELVRSS